MSKYGGKKSWKDREIDEVEELLRATEDEMVLKLSVGSHMSRTSSSTPLDQDLIRRFEALKTPSVSNKITSVPPEKKDDGDISARFDALKGAGPSGVRSSLDGGDQRSDNDVEENEVEKLIQWAKDAARLDPSVSDKEDDEVSNSDDDVSVTDDDTDDEDGKKDKKRKPRKL
ncbi:hypothetical protein IFM89_036313 [Coptis chinensis]|uniref:Uncharacterized protein n=1 Tax=Coptis chinensis TaxID=261450 RepID=A0A835M5Q6_9MAGN|nr:hypothetical protein IFM89_036313 [Coptis chinensis]